MRQRSVRERDRNIAIAFYFVILPFAIGLAAILLRGRIAAVFGQSGIDSNLAQLTARIATILMFVSVPTAAFVWVRFVLYMTDDTGISIPMIFILFPVVIGSAILFSRQSLADAIGPGLPFNVWKILTYIAQGIIAFSIPGILHMLLYFVRVIIDSINYRNIQRIAARKKEDRELLFQKKYSLAEGLSRATQTEGDVYTLNDVSMTQKELLAFALELIKKSGRDHTPDEITAFRVLQFFAPKQNRELIGWNYLEPYLKLCKTYQSGVAGNEYQRVALALAEERPGEETFKDLQSAMKWTDIQFFGWLKTRIEATPTNKYTEARFAHALLWGKGTEKDEKRAYALLKKLESSNVSHVKSDLAACYILGFSPLSKEESDKAAFKLCKEIGMRPRSNTEKTDFYSYLPFELSGSPQGVQLYEFGKTSFTFDSLNFVNVPLEKLFRLLANQYFSEGDYKSAAPFYGYLANKKLATDPELFYLAFSLDYFNEYASWEKELELYEGLVSKGYHRNGAVYNNLCRLYFYGYGCKVDYAKALSLAQKAYELGSKNSLWYLTEAYMHGKGVAFNLPLAVKYARLHYEHFKTVDSETRLHSAEAAESKLKALIEQDELTDENAVTDRQLCRLLCKLAAFMRDGSNRYRDEKMAFAILETAAELDASSGELCLAMAECLEKGIGVAADTGKASQWRNSADYFMPKDKPFYDTTCPNCDNKEFTAMDELNALIGLSEVKEEVRTLSNLAKTNQKRKKMGLPENHVAMHLVFTGNPGTGKTTVARLLAQIYKNLGLLSKGHTVEANRHDLVGNYIGDTEANTTKKIQEALGGVLFIDEAYSLVNKGEKDFGQHVIEILLDTMEKHKDDLMVIVAGYPDLMESFINSNPGLKSRFSTYIRFEDYSEEELYAIFRSLCRPKSYRLSPKADIALKKTISNLVKNKDANFGNGRAVRKLFDNVIKKQSNRLAKLDNATKEDLMLILEKDFAGLN